MPLEREFAVEWDRVCSEVFVDSDVQKTEQLGFFILERRRDRAPGWTEEWISPIDAQFAAATLAMDESDGTHLIVDEGDGSVATAVGHYLAALSPTAVFEVVASRLSQRALNALAELDGCVGVFPETAIRTRRYGANAGVVGRFSNHFHALSSFSSTAELFGSFNTGQHILIHEVWRGHRYPFQYHLGESLPNLAHVLELLCRLQCLEHAGHSAFLLESKLWDFEHLNFGSDNRSSIMSSYRSARIESD